MTNNIKASNSQPVSSSPFSIATPVVTTFLPMAESLNDTSFMIPTTVYLQTHQTEIATHQDTSETFKTEAISLEQAHEQTEIVNDEDCSQPTDEDPPDTGSKSKSIKKRSKNVKKSAKLDAKSKLEKSRQSARECRARKKLRYQYLEDLVCNREKAVTKLREELIMVSTGCIYKQSTDWLLETYLYPHSSMISLSSLKLAH